MRILIGHNHYQQPGGEDAVVRNEFSLLKNFGEDVYLYERSNAEFSKISYSKQLSMLSSMGWSHDSYSDIRKIIKKFRPDIAHFHNIFYMLTPSVYQACRDEGVPVVHSLHNFRLLCSNGLLFRNNRVCEKCIERKNLNWGIYHRCSRNSLLFTAAIVHMLKRHWREGTWTKMVDQYIMASEFGRQKLMLSGIPKEKISIKPPVVHPDEQKSNYDEGYALYAGRLSEEKGVHILLEAWKEIHGLPLKIAGDGHLMSELEIYVKKNNMSSVEFLGFISGDQYEKYMKGAKVLIVPSTCYENFPHIVIEAYSYGLPVVSSSLGSFPEVVKEGETGLLFDPTDPHDLAKKIQWISAHQAEIDQMKEKVKQIYKEQYSGRRNYEILMDVYRRAIQR